MRKKTIVTMSGHGFCGDLFAVYTKSKYYIAYPKLTNVLYQLYLSKKLNQDQKCIETNISKPKNILKCHETISPRDFMNKV